VPNELLQLLNNPLSERSLWAIQAATLDRATTAAQPLPYFVVASIAGNIAGSMEGGPVSADVAEVRDKVVRPALTTLIREAESADAERLVRISNDAIRASLLSR